MSLFYTSRLSSKQHKYMLVVLKTEKLRRNPIFS